MKVDSPLEIITQVLSRHILVLLIHAIHKVASEARVRGPERLGVLKTSALF